MASHFNGLLRKPEVLAACILRLTVQMRNRWRARRSVNLLLRCLVSRSPPRGAPPSPPPPAPWADLAVSPGGIKDAISLRLRLMPL